MRHVWSRRHTGTPPGTRDTQDAYAVSAEFYDVLQGERDASRVRALYGADVRGARHGVLDLGAGTGRVTLMSLVESRVAVHAVEPARTMRSPLMTRLASLPPDLLARVTVHAQPLDEAGLEGVADVAICHNTVASLEPSVRRALWPALAGAIVPGGSLVLQLPPSRLPASARTHAFPRRRVGRHEYGGRMVTAADRRRIRARFDYWVRGPEGVLREHSETFWMWPAPRAELIGEAEEHGFTALPAREDHGVLALRRLSG